MLVALANIKLSDLLAQRPKGEPVNTHVIIEPPTQVPDFESMRKLVHGNGETSERKIGDARPERAVPKDG